MAATTYELRRVRRNKAATMAMAATPDELRRVRRNKPATIVQASSDFHSDASSDPSSRHPLSDHSSPDLLSTSAGPSRKRRRSPMTSVPALSPVSGALSPVHADLIPSPKRVRDSGYSTDVEVNPRETSLRDDAIRVEARVVVEADDRDETETGGEAVRQRMRLWEDLVFRGSHDHTQTILVHQYTDYEGVHRSKDTQDGWGCSRSYCLTER
ncbi:hypothetical protein Tco_0874759 [Tanacetum coccineum]|uniref:Uncharacterized protein n=1 Tax=Tanacetum coccineum TaxID=301880 RepID=A0ABQ5BR64_9ASTR